METTLTGMYGNVFRHQMSVPRAIRFAYIKELHNSYIVGRDNISKHKNEMITGFKNGKIVYGPIVYGNQDDKLYPLIQLT